MLSTNYRRTSPRSVVVSGLWLLSLVVVRLSGSVVSSVVGLGGGSSLVSSVNGLGGGSSLVFSVVGLVAVPLWSRWWWFVCLVSGAAEILMVR